jgi:hypothetical protein
MSKGAVSFKEVHVMMDLETLGLAKNAVITRIAAVSFDIDTGEIIDEIDLLVNAKSCVKVNLQIDGDTICWWLKQDESIINETFIPCITKGLDIKEALGTFTEWIEKLKKNNDTYNVRVWGNGACADNVWMASAYAACHMSVPWRFTHDMDLRTLVYLGEKIAGVHHKKSVKFVGNRHNPLDDAKHQVLYAVAIMNSLKSSFESGEKLKSSVDETSSDIIVDVP